MDARRILLQADLIQENIDLDMESIFIWTVSSNIQKMME